jgi:stalled ribosome rescue protein Dom34
MAHYVIWLDSEKAHIFNLKAAGIEKSHLERHENNHHTRNKKDNPGDSAGEHFYRDLAVRLGDAEEILILGPGLAKKIVGMENSDHPTDNQILATARTFFKTYNLFNHPIQTLN